MLVVLVTLLIIVEIESAFCSFKWIFQEHYTLHPVCMG
ncbi:hypothetical protein GGP68_002589 [Salinibacter ruber]|uniref:Uncharacterized protein n=1 Tax=Salinibacter ruber TaxID=146919 RepID=A0A9X2Q3Q9_9BACT|nr:hypothetical protein [Salinibacter ruber]MCS3710959.1 hypothetical protein [Salinibacter ruber]